MELRERLRHALRSDATRSRAVEPRYDNATAALRGIPGLQQKETAAGTVYLTEQSWPLGHEHGRLTLDGALGLGRAPLARIAPGVRPADLRNAAFFDVETTGLSGGTGTYVFLIGIGAFEGDSFTLRQFFLAGLGGEPAMLSAVLEALAGHRALVSFNGRRFDVPLLETRLTLSRLPFPPRVPHLDLLYPARRLYRHRLPSCRLGVLEELVLGLEREDDVPGWLVPSLYIEYMRRGIAGPLRGVFEHNALDILSLVTLLAQIGNVVGGTTVTDADDYLALGRWDEADGRLTEAASRYASALEAGADGETGTFARQRLARLYRRLHRPEDSARLWREETDGRGPVEGRLRALVELAKLEEHRWRNHAEAAALTDRALALLDVAELRGDSPNSLDLRREALEHRLGRVRRRLAGRS